MDDAIRHLKAAHHAMSVAMKRMIDEGLQVTEEYAQQARLRATIAQVITELTKYRKLGIDLPEDDAWLKEHGD